MTKTPKIVQSFNSTGNTAANQHPTNLFPKQVTPGNYLLFYQEGTGGNVPPLTPTQFAGYPSLYSHPASIGFNGGLATTKQPLIANPNGISINGFEIENYKSSTITAIPAQYGLQGEDDVFQEYTQIIPASYGTANLVLVFAQYSGVVTFDSFSVVSPSSFNTLYIGTGALSPAGNPGHVVLAASNVPIGNTLVNFGSEIQPGGSWEYFWVADGSASVVIL